MEVKHLNGLNIDENDFAGLPLEKQMNILYKNSEETKAEVKSIKVQLAKKRKVDAAISGIGGILGGMITMVGKWTIFRG